MTEPTCLVLYGNSVFLAGIRAELGRYSGLDLVTVEHGSSDAADLVRDQRPSVVLFALAAGQPDFGLALLCERSGILLIGVDPSSDDLLMLSARSQWAPCLQDLRKAIGA